jgi:exoribonuclease R
VINLLNYHQIVDKFFDQYQLNIRQDNDDWQDKHPRGKLDCVIGPVDILSNFYEYQLFCKKLNVSINKFQKDTSKSLEINTCSNRDGIFELIKTKYPSIQDRTAWRVITIDPPTSLDFDDGFSIVEHDDGTQQLSIYISNVTIWLDVLNLWNSFSKRISTIYLPDKKRPMLPTILSDGLCSLQENVVRVAFVIDVFIKEGEILNIQFSNSLIKVYKNYCYPNHLSQYNPKSPAPISITIANIIKKITKLLGNPLLLSCE